MSHAKVYGLPRAHWGGAVPPAGTCGLQVETVRVDDTRAVLAVEGDLDLANADLLAGMLSHHAARGRRFLRLDLSLVDFIDCTGLSAIVQAHNELLAVGGQLVLTGIDPHAGRLLRLTHLDEVLYVANGHNDEPELRQPGHLSPVPGP